MNSLSGLINKIVSLFFVFWVRCYFTRYLNTELLGLEGLFANILGVFSLVDAGFGTAISFSLFKPLHENNRELVGAIMKLYKKVYLIIGTIIIGLSVLITPIIPLIIKGTTIQDNEIRLFFMVYALSVGISYFFAYKRTLLFALQKNYKVLNVDTAVRTVQSITQIIAIVAFNSYLGYLICLVVFGFIGNLICSIIANKENAYDDKASVALPKKFKTALYSNIKTLAITNVSWIGISSTDNIVISALVGVLDLAKNANYSTITSSLAGFVNIVLGGVSASIGDLLTENNNEKSKQYFNRYTFIYQSVAGYASVGILCAGNPLIQLWVGSDYLFQSIIVLIIAANLYLTLIFKPLADYQNYAGLFKYYKPYSVIAFILNIVVSIALTLTIGISGVFLGTTITYVFMIVSVIKILYKHYFNESSRDYYVTLSKNIFVMVMSALLISFVHFGTQNLILNFFVQLILITVIYFVVISLVFMKDDSFAFFFDYIKKIL